MPGAENEQSECLLCLELPPGRLYTFGLLAMDTFTEHLLCARSVHRPFAYTASFQSRPLPHESPILQVRTLRLRKTK